MNALGASVSALAGIVVPMTHVNDEDVGASVSLVTAGESARVWQRMSSLDDTHGSPYLSVLLNNS